MCIADIDVNPSQLKNKSQRTLVPPSPADQDKPIAIKDEHQDDVVGDMMLDVGTDTETATKFLKHSLTMEMVDIGVYRRIPTDVIIKYGQRYDIFPDDQRPDIKSFKFCRWSDKVSFRKKRRSFLCFVYRFPV